VAKAVVVNTQKIINAATNAGLNRFIGLKVLSIVLSVSCLV